MKEERIGISVVSPVFNERDNVEELHRELISSLEKMGKSFEIIFVDDGSTDSTFEKLKKLREKDERVKIIRFRKNFGQTAALSAGFDYSKGEVVITIDADLQNDPSDIEILLEKLKEGYDLVSGWRWKRKDKFFTRVLPSKIANFLISLITGVKLHDYGCTLKAYRSEIVKNIKLYGEMHRFVPAVASLLGVRVAEVKVNHRQRKAGRSKYGLGRTVKVILDLITVKFLISYSTRPLQIFGLIGLLTGGTGFLLGIYLTYLKLIEKQAIGNRPLLLLSVLLIFLGAQFISLGLLAEMLSRTYHEAVEKKIYFIKELHGFEEKV
ncbi:MAG: glycosyltransferase family 2 protein [Candidatus Aminicenantia bacterium]